MKPNLRVPEPGGRTDPGPPTSVSAPYVARAGGIDSAQVPATAADRCRAWLAGRVVAPLDSLPAQELGTSRRPEQTGRRSSAPWPAPLGRRNSSHGLIQTIATLVAAISAEEWCPCNRPSRKRLVKRALQRLQVAAANGAADDAHFAPV